MRKGKEILMAVLYDKEAKIVTITIKLTETLNRIDAQTFQAFSTALMDFRDDSEALVAIITGTGEVFSTGADHDKLLRPWADKSFQVQPTITRGLDIWKPLIAAINGPARGGGLEIALACDIRIASENVYLQMPELGRGLIPGLGGTQRLPRMVSSAKAAEMIFLRTPITAEEAYRLGLVNKVVPLAQLLPTAKEWAAKICENGPLAIRRAKEAMIRGRNMALEDGLSLELAFFEEMLQSEDYQEGLRALAEERKPEYKGR
ncbi:MAG: enoyl-CoA hydratase/isomerase family protein [Deltaproteobacteria bacterium]|nr:MAG: enoyl-CoA hydratase/isomerase family protein [Deltaproteobacteria bacterium]